MADEHPPDEPAEDPDGQRTALPGKVERWRRRSATGAIMTGFAFGMREVFDAERKEPAIVQETSGDPPEDLAVDAEFDPLVARRSVVRIRPWLLHDVDEEPEGHEGPEEHRGDA